MICEETFFKACMNHFYSHNFPSATRLIRFNIEVEFVKQNKARHECEFVLDFWGGFVT